MVTRRTVFARALPSEIRIEETYPYVARVRGGVHVEPRAIDGDNADSTGASPRPGQGFVEVRVPYDGQKSFDEVALDDVQQAVAIRAGIDVDELDAPLEARIGHLVVQDFGRSNLAHDSRLSSWNAVDVTVPVLGRGIESLDDLKSGQLEGRWRLKYAPESPQPSPISVHVAITDEDALYHLQQKLEEEKDEKTVEHLHRELADLLARKAEFTPSLRLVFDVQLTLAAPLGVLDDPNPPELKQLWIEWPAMTAYRRIFLQVEGKTGNMEPHPVFFDPATKRLQLGGLRFFPPKETTEKGLYCYRAPRVELHVREARELVDASTLTGNLAVEMPALLSKLALNYFDALGVQRELSAKVKSTLDVALFIELVECFERRKYSPYQYLQFPGIVLDQMRLWDIIGLLKSMQFEIVDGPVKVPVPDAGQAPTRFDHLVAATRAEGAGSVWLWLRVGGQSLQAERQREGENGDSHKISRGSGDLTIALRSELEGEGQRAVEILNELHERLKQRFHFERVIS